MSHQIWVAETFTVTFESVERYDPAKGNPRQWLYGIANNQLKRLWRSKRVSMNARPPAGNPDASHSNHRLEEIEAAGARLDADRIAEALARVPARSREAVRLRVIEQLDYSDIARQLGCTPKSARDLVFRGLRCLRTEFDFPAHVEGKP